MRLVLLAELNCVYGTCPDTDAAAAASEHDTVQTESRKGDVVL